MKSYTRHILLSVVTVFLLCNFMIFTQNSFAATNGEGYCQVPPYVIQNTPPNIMVVVDISGSMYNFAYSDGFETVATADDNMCTGSGSPCTGFANPGAYPTYKYYGYFNPDYWYTYGSNKFAPTAPKTGSGFSGARAKNSNEWDGNFLNWLTMRRTDILRKVLTGGLVSSIGGTYSRLRGEEADDINYRGGYKQIANIEIYADSAAGTGTKCITFSDGASSPSQFTVRNTSSCTSGTLLTRSVEVDVLNPIEGVIQSIVGTKARLGLTFYKPNTSGLTHATDQGGVVQVSVGGLNLSAIVNQVNNTAPSTNTPLGETLWTVVGYHAQQASMLGGPGPRYANVDYTINNPNDPFNYGTGGQPRWPTCAKAYVLYITDGEPCSDGRLPASLSDYAGTAGSPYNCTGTSCPAVGPFAASTFPTCGAGGYVAGIEDVALYAHTTDLRSATLGVNNINDIQNLTIFPVFAFGKGSTLLRYAAINGGFRDSNSNNLPDLQSEWDANGDNEPDNFYEATDGYALEQALKNAFSTMLERASSGTAASVLASGEGSGANLLQAVFYPRRRIGNDVISWVGAIQNLWYYVDPYYALSSIREDTVKDIPNSILHLIDDYIVDLSYDNVAQETRAYRCQDTDGDGDCDVVQPTLLFESLGNIWEAGKSLWSRDISTDPRTVYTHINGSNLISFSTANANTLRPYFNLPTSGDTNLDGFIDGDINHDGSVNNTDAEYLIRYVHGEDGTVVDLNSDGLPEYRSRTVTVGSDTYSWKLGDILNSTPKISSWIPLHPGYYDYHVYRDSTYGPACQGCSVSSTSPHDPSHFTTMDTQSNVVDGVNLGVIDGYTRRGMVFVGGNDGMLHAFKLGSLELKWTGKTDKQKAMLSGTNLGREMWAFIPKNVLPYLKYMMDPEYCHVYSVDLTPIIVDVSINNDHSVASPGNCSDTNYWNCTKTPSSWRTVLIGGMRLGGACRRTDDSTCTDCVKAPGSDLNFDGDKADPGENLIGLSSYFALDITDQNNPRLLWEFTDEDMGFASTGAGIVKIAARDATGNVDVSKNGRWFVVLASGPRGPISVGDMQFLGRSDKPLNLFVLDLKNGALLRKITMNGTAGMPNIPNAFASSMFDTARDFIQKNTDYQDDAVYIGYTKKCTATTNICTNNTWTNGGVIRLVTKKNLSGDSPLDPANWAASSVIDGVGPVTAGVKSLQESLKCNTNSCATYLFFGSGRYFYVQGSDVDDPDKSRAIFGLKEPCFLANGTFDSNCTASASFCTNPLTAATCGSLRNVTNIANVLTSAQAKDTTYRGWYINLDGLGNFTYPEGSPPGNVTRRYKTERLITDPSSSTCGAAFFVTFKPYEDECALGGKSFLWGVDYATGGFLPPDCQYIALVQLSTGSIEHITLSGSRKSMAFEGVPPLGGGLTVFSPPKPLKRILHIRER